MYTCIRGHWIKFLTNKKSDYFGGKKGLENSFYNLNTLLPYEKGLG